jgi:hypothetical protein
VGFKLSRFRTVGLKVASCGCGNSVQVDGKERGNELFKRGLFAEAAEEYKDVSQSIQPCSRTYRTCFVASFA